MIPSYEAVMLPMLKLLADGKERRIAECRQALAIQFHLTDDELAEVLPSGRMPVFNSRVHWAKTYLAKAGVVESPRRGVVRIKQRGQLLLAQELPELTTRILTERFVEMREWRQVGANAGASTKATNQPDQQGNELPPDEELESSYLRLRETIQDELLDQVRRMTPAMFEKLVVDLLLALGYGGVGGVGLQVGQSGDHGIDGVIYQDKLGLDLIYVQAKRWTGNSVSGAVVREFAGALSAKRARRGVLVTSSTFTRDARDDAERIGERIVLIDGKRLVELMYETGLGVTTKATYHDKRIDADYFDQD